jgi:hypothetical protein
MKNRISILAKIIKPNLTQINDVEGLKVVANHLLDPNFKFKKNTKKLKDLQEQFKGFKQQNTASAKTNSNTIVDFKITGLKDLEEPRFIRQMPQIERVRPYIIVLNRLKSIHMLGASFGPCLPCPSYDMIGLMTCIQPGLIFFSSLL